jgi:hypothetical protein
MAVDNPNPTTPSDHSSLEKETGGVKNNEHLETIRTVSRVPGNPHYYEKDGLRTYGDDEDHDHEPPVSFTAFDPSTSYTDRCRR